MFVEMRARTRFDVLAMPHLTAVYRLARQLAGPQLADDLTQETFLRAWKSFDQFDANTNCRAWLCRILYNTWISQWRKTRRELPVADVENVRIEPHYDWEEDFLRVEMSQDMEWALGQLPDAFRWSVLLADVEEFTYQEIATAMACPIGTVMSRINRGRRMLAGLLRSRVATEPSAPLRIIRKRKP